MWGFHTYIAQLKPAQTSRHPVQHEFVIKMSDILFSDHSFWYCDINVFWAVLIRNFIISVPVAYKYSEKNHFHCLQCWLLTGWGHQIAFTVSSVLNEVSKKQLKFQQSGMYLCMYVCIVSTLSLKIFVFLLPR
jgi:hypothetical protein